MTFTRTPSVTAFSSGARNRSGGFTLVSRRFGAVLFGLLVGLDLAFGANSAQAASATWDGGASGTGSAWLTNTNWATDPVASPGSTSVTTNTDVGTFGAAGSAGTIGINLNFTGNTYYLGAVELTSADTIARSIGDSSATAGTLQLNGATVNSVNNVILRNASAAALTIQASQTGTMGLALGNATDNVVQIDGAGGVTISSIISGASKKLTKAGSGAGVLTLTGANTFSGGVTLTAGSITIVNGTELGTGTFSVNSPTTTTFLTVNNTAAVTLANDIVLTTPVSAATYFLGKTTSGAGTGTQLNLTGIISGGNANATLSPNTSVGGDATTTFRLAGNNSFRASISINRGSLVIANANGLGNALNSVGVALPQAEANTNYQGRIRFEVGGTFANPFSTAISGSNGYSINTNANNVTLSGLISNTAPITKYGSGTLTLSNATNSFNGVTSINGGLISVSTLGDGGVAGGLGQASNAASNIILNGGGLQYTGPTTNTNRSFTIGNGVLDASGTGAINFTNTGAIAFTTTLTQNAATTTTGTNTITIQNGAGVTVGQTVTGTGVPASTTITAINGDIITISNNLTGASGTNVPITFTGGNKLLTLTGTNSNLNTLAASITNVGSGFTTGVTKSGTGTWALTSAANTYTGLTTVNAGELDLNKAANVLSVPGNLTIGDGSGGANSDIVKLLANGQIVSTAALLINGTSGKLDLNGNTQTIGSLADTGVVTAGGSSVALGTSGALTVGDATASTTFSGAITGASATLTKQGAGILVLAGTNANTYTGVTTVNAGELDLGKTGVNAIGGNLTVSGGVAKLTGSGGDQIANTASVIVSGGTFDIVALNETVAGVQLTSGSISGSGGTLTSTTTFDVQAGAVSAILGGSVGLTKTTAGTVTLSGINSYSGTTTVSNGTLGLSATSTNNIASSPTIDIASGAILDVVGLTGGALELGGTVAETLKGNGSINGNLSVLANSAIAPGNSIGTLTMTGIGAVSLAGTLQIELDGNGGGAGLSDLLDLSGGSAGALTLTSSSIVTFSLLGVLNDPAYVFAKYDTLVGTFGTAVAPAGYHVDYNYLGLNQIAVVVPEPGTFAMLLFGLIGMWMFRDRRPGSR